VKKHVSNIYASLGELKSRAALAVWWQSHSLLENFISEYRTELNLDDGSECSLQSVNYESSQEAIQRLLPGAKFETIDRQTRYVYHHSVFNGNHPCGYITRCFVLIGYDVTSIIHARLNAAA
jgi:hypothetical protein